MRVSLAGGARAGIAVLFLLIGLALVPATVPGAPEDVDPDAALTNVDIVRMSARRVPEAEIVRAIHQAPAVDFDLDPEMVIELRRAGVTEAVIEAMKEAVRRTAPAAPGTAPPGAGPAAAVGPGAILRFEGDPDGDPMSRTAVFFREDPQGRPVELGFFVLCVDPTHVPDLWQTKTPFVEGTPRHRLIAFHEESALLPKRRKQDRIMLVLPGEMPLTLDAGMHTLLFGVSARVGDTPPAPIAWLESKVLIPPDNAARITLAIATRSLGGLKAPPRGVELHTLKVVALDPAP